MFGLANYKVALELLGSWLVLCHTRINPHKIFCSKDFRSVDEQLLILLSRVKSAQKAPQKVLFRDMKAYKQRNEQR